MWYQVFDVVSNDGLRCVPFETHQWLKCGIVACLSSMPSQVEPRDPQVTLMVSAKFTCARENKQGNLLGIALFGKWPFCE